AVRDDLLRRRIFLLPDPELQWAAIDVRRVVRLALMLEHGHAGDVEGLRVAARRVVQRDAGEVTLDVARDAVAEVLVILADPFARDAELRSGGPGCEKQQERERT